MRGIGYAVAQNKLLMSGWLWANRAIAIHVLRSDDGRNRRAVSEGRPNSYLCADEDWRHYAPPIVRVQVLMVTAWPLVIEVLSSSRSPPPLVAVIVPCSWQVVPALSNRR